MIRELIKIDGGCCNSYLVKTVSGNYVVDYGRGEKMRAALAGTRVDRIFLTHAHRENCAGLCEPEWLAKDGGPEVVAFGAEYELLADIPGYWQKWGTVYESLGTPYVRPPARQLAPPVVDATKIFKAPQVINAAEVFRASPVIDAAEVFGAKPAIDATGDADAMDAANDTDDAKNIKVSAIAIPPFKAVPTPGHSPSHTSYLINFDGKTCAFTGGLIYKGGKLPNLYDYEWDYGYMKGLFETVKSLRALAEYKPETLYPDRGEAIENGTEELIRFADKLEAFAKFLLRDYKSDGLTDTPRDNIPATKPTRIEGIDEITPHLLRAHIGYSNMYIVICRDGTAFLVDCWINGLRGAAAGEKEGASVGESDTGARVASETGFARAMKAIADDYGIKSYKCMLLTHYHGDHILNYREMRKIWGTEMWAPENAVDILENPFKYRYPATLPWYYRDDSPEMMPAAYYEEASAAESGNGRTNAAYRNKTDAAGYGRARWEKWETPVDRALRDGVTIKIGEYEIKVFHLPGQTTFSSGYFTVIDGVRAAFTGDNIYYSPDESVSGHDCFAVANRALPEREGYLKCARTLLELAPDRLYCGHSHIIDKPEGQLWRLEKFSLELIEKLKQFSPEKEYEYFADPYWAAPYGAVIRGGRRGVHAVVRLKNHGGESARFTGRLCVYEPIHCEDGAFDVILPAYGEINLSFYVYAEKGAAPGLYPVVVDIVRDGADYGELFDNVIRVVP